MDSNNDKYIISYLRETMILKNFRQNKYLFDPTKLYKLLITF